MFNAFHLYSNHQEEFDVDKLFNFLGFLWKYYLSYCEGGFRSRNIDVGQFLIKKN